MSNMSKVTGSIVGFLGSEPRLTRVGDQGTARTPPGPGRVVRAR